MEIEIQNNRTKFSPEVRFNEFNSNWEECPIGEIVNIYDGTHQTPKYVESGVPFVSVENIKNYKETTKYITPQAFEKEYKVKPCKGDILMTRITAGIIGDTAIVLDNNPLAYYVSLALLRLKEKRVEVEFLNQYINTEYFKRELHKRIIHIAFPKKINLGEIKHCKISYPEDEEQQKIASFLSAVDERFYLLEQKKFKLEEYRKGVMHKIFSREIRFKPRFEDLDLPPGTVADLAADFPDWEEKKLGEIAKKESSSISANTLEKNNGEFKIYGATGFLKNVDFYEQKEPYISIVKDGAGVGRTLLCDAFSSVLGTLDIIKPRKETNLIFLYYQLNQIRFTKYITGSTIPHIYFKDYSKEKLMVPCIEEQNKIAAFLGSIDQKIALVEKQIKDSSQFKKGLLQQMFV